MKDMWGITCDGELIDAYSSQLRAKEVLDSYERVNTKHKWAIVRVKIASIYSASEFTPA
jgi:hypothetical protein